MSSHDDMTTPNEAVEAAAKAWDKHKDRYFTEPALPHLQAQTVRPDLGAGDPCDCCNNLP